ncbi:MAG: efflux RND transporter periplasmic adaptor subunit [Cyanobacteria bacterium P01_C01_bin.72]
MALCAKSISVSRLMLLSSLFLTSGCGLLPPGDAQSESVSPQPEKLAAVDVAIAREGILSPKQEYIGTTFPVREVALRSRIEGQILDLAVDVGDRVEQGQVLGRIDAALLASAVLEAEAELAALESEVTSRQADVNEAIAQVEQAKLELAQAQSDAARANKLLQQGAVTEQAAELERTEVGTAQQLLQSAQQQVENRQSAVFAAQRRVIAQEALLAQEQRRKSFAVLRSPITGSVLAKAVETGDLAQPGDEILRLGDFSQIQVQVQISELELGSISLGQTTQVKLDAFPEQTFAGELTQIALEADPTARLIPVEITVPNQDRRIGKGLLARVNFVRQSDRSIVVPETALEVSSESVQGNSEVDTATIFILQEAGEQATVTKRQVKLGDRANSLVEIVAGLEAGEKFVVRSSRELENDEPVRLSFISESASQ